LIISIIPSKIGKHPVFEIIPYPDQNNNILTENVFDKYFLYEDEVFNLGLGDACQQKATLSREYRHGHSGEQAETRAQGGRLSATESSKEDQQERQGQ